MANMLGVTTELGINDLIDADYFQSLFNNFVSLAPLRSEQDSSGDDPEADPQTVRKCASQQCVNRILDCYLDEVFNFYPGKPTVPAFGQRSLNEVISAFEKAKKSKQDSRDSYPQVFRRGELGRHTLRCTCDKCRNGEAVELRGEPHPFGKGANPKHEILIYEFNDKDVAKEEDAPRAVILVEDDKGNYRLWSRCRRGSNATDYYDWVILESVSTHEVEPSSGTQGRSRKRPAVEEAHGSGMAEPQRRKKTASTGQPSRSSHGKATSRPTLASKTASANTIGNLVADGEGTMSPPGLPASNDMADQAATDDQGPEPSMVTRALSQQPAANPQQHTTMDGVTSGGSLPRSNPTPPQSTPNVQRQGPIDLQTAYNDAEEHVADLQENSGSFVIDTNVTLRQHFERLKSAAVGNNHLSFGIMWNRLNRDLEQAGVAKLPDL